jgi:hypothetical protein
VRFSRVSRVRRLLLSSPAERLRAEVQRHGGAPLAPRPLLYQVKRALVERAELHRRLANAALVWHSERKSHEQLPTIIILCCHLCMLL